MNQMQFDWKQYTSNDAALVDSWLDDCAVRGTGLENGWHHFYNYWMTENPSAEAKDRCFLISHENTPFAVMYLAIIDNCITISEYVVSPNKRGMGYGTAVIEELLHHSAQLLNINASVAEAVVYPNNIASKKAFENAGFMLVSKHSDGDAYYYRYKF